MNNKIGGDKSFIMDTYLKNTTFYLSKQVVWQSQIIINKKSIKLGKKPRQREKQQYKTKPLNKAQK